LIGSVFTKCPVVFIFIIPYENNSYVRFWQIGFVLHNLLFLIDFTPLAAGACKNWLIFDSYFHK
jgi:hypothetical protein